MVWKIFKLDLTVDKLNGEIFNIVSPNWYCGINQFYNSIKKNTRINNF